MRAGDPETWDAFFLRFEPVLGRDARRIGVPDAVRDDLVCETIGAVLDQLSAPDAVVPGALGGYLRCALRNRARNRARNHARGERRRERRAVAAAEPVADCAGVVASTVSAHTLALVRGPVADEWAAGDLPVGDLPAGASGEEDGAPADANRWPVGDPIRDLAHALAAALRPGERELLERKHAGATYPELAAWLGIGAAAAAKRVVRLRQRLHAAAEAYAAELPPGERRGVCRFLGRARAAALPAVQSPGGAEPRRPPRTAGLVPVRRAAPPRALPSAATKAFS